MPAVTVTRKRELKNCGNIYNIETLEEFENSELLGEIVNFAQLELDGILEDLNTALKISMETDGRERGWIDPAYGKHF